MRTEKAVLRRIKAWKNNPMLVSGVYRLFTYIHWDKIPEEYHEFFPEEAKETWDNNLDLFSKREVALDILAQIQALLKLVAKKNIINCLGIIPMLMADIYMFGKSTDRVQADLLKVIRNYQDYIDIDRALAEEYAAKAIIDLFKYIISYLKLKPHFDFDNAIEGVLKNYEQKQGVELTPELNAKIDKVLEEYNEQDKK